jgi:FAD-linked sulfhydryl oxidase
MAINISPQAWGPKLWKSLHYIAFAYPEQPSDEQKRAALGLLQALGQLLPCEKCRQHYSAYLAEFPPNVDSRTAFARYLNELHNKVNARLGKTSIAHDPSQPYTKPARATSWGQILIAVVFGILLGLLINRWR